MAAKVRWLGHACFLITSPKGVKIIIDPWIKENPLCPVKIEEISEVDLVLVTHDHFDHAGDAAEIVKRTQAVLVAAPETAAKFQSQLGVPSEKVVFGGFGMNIGGTAIIKDINVIMTQALHSSETACPAGYIIRLEDGFTIYHAGDTGIFESMRLLGELYPLDLALLPIGGVFTMDSYQAARALKLLKPKRAIPMHYKTFPILEQSPDRFVELARKEAPEVEIVVLEPGEERAF